MSDFLRLVQNENMKIYRRMRTWIMFAILVALSIMFGTLFYLGSASSPLSAWDAVDQLSVLYFLVSIFSVVIASDIVAGEFTWGTIKLLLIRPWTRSKILFSKLLAVLIFTLASTAVFLIANLAVSFLLFPNTGSVIFPETQGAGPLASIMENLLYSYIDLLVITIFAFMISTVFRSGGIAIGLSMFILFAGNIFTMLFHPSRYAWAKYMLFVNMDLSQYRGGQVGPAGMTLGFSATVLALYVLAFLAVSWLVFNKRDVAA
ncbi:ABC transporter permease [Paenibacillus sp. M1]|uniref:ABC transporter permease n=1 Tax=Paenibacillus haidiansis TaxID=1574488 RepID=A0ABU7VV10_9BACL